MQPMQAFRTVPEVKVLLISLKAGGVALNLTHASYCYLMVSTQQYEHDTKLLSAYPPAMREQQHIPLGMQGCGM